MAVEKIHLILLKCGCNLLLCFHFLHTIFLFVQFCGLIVVHTQSNYFSLFKFHLLKALSCDVLSLLLESHTIVKIISL